jgi:hypothetical protein
MRLSILTLAFLTACSIATVGQKQDPAAMLRAREQEVLVYIIRTQGRGSVLYDSTYGHGCRDRQWCRNEGAPDDAWQSYVRNSSDPAALRDLLPPDLPVTYESEIGDESAVRCTSRRYKLELSRVGVSADGNVAVVSYTHWHPMDHLGCGAISGATVVVRRSENGEWKQDPTPLSTVIN